MTSTTQFVTEIIENGCTHIKVRVHRDRVDAYRRQFAGKAWVWEIGNVIAMDRRGRVRQLIGAEIRKAGINDR